MFKKHWITLLGALFTFLAFAYLFKYAVDEGWISDNIKIGFGIIAGLGLFIGGFGIRQKKYEIVGQILNGLGVAILYITFSFAGVYYSIWSPMTVFWAMVGVTSAAFVYSYKFDSRILINIGLLGALISPFVLKSRGDQVFTLFLYLLVVNVFYLFVSVSKDWIELRLISFFGTLVLYASYYIHFDPKGWIYPFLYAACGYLFYIASFTISSIKEKSRYSILNLCLGVVNAGMFSFWSMVVLQGVVDLSVIFMGMGLIHIISSLIIYKTTKNYNENVIANFFGGVLFLIITGSEFGKGLDIKPLISVYSWCLISIALLAIGQFKDLRALKLISAVIWVLTGAYWYTTTWKAPLGIWFGTFIPVLNWSGLAWVTLAAIGFYFSIKVKFGSSIKYDERFMSNIFALVSHLIVGGLLTFQIDNIFEEYSIKAVDLWLTLSVTWGFYALLLFMWGAYSKQKFFRWFGSAVLIIVSIKTIFLDLSNSEMIFKVLAMFILAIITFGISFINSRWKDDGARTKENEDAQLTENQNTNPVLNINEDLNFSEEKI